MEVGYIKGTFDYTWELADGMSWTSLNYLASELGKRNLIKTSRPFEDIKKYIHYASSYPLKDQVVLTSPDLLSHTNDDKIFTQECDLIDSALKNIEPDQAIENKTFKEKQ